MYVLWYASTAQTNNSTGVAGYIIMSSSTGTNVQGEVDPIQNPVTVTNSARPTHTHRLPSRFNDCFPLDLQGRK